MLNYFARCLSAVALTVALAVPGAAHAFKIDTHLWIGQQVINDLEDDGNITVKLKGQPVTLPVPAAVRTAILANRQAFLLGNIGPDSFPDVVIGQTVVHPGLDDGWKTNDWLNFLMKKSEGSPVGTAFAYGYLGHAASDVFAHTYVNQYAGDVFDLSDETLVEQRHVALESFIGRRNPPLLNAAGQSLGTPYAYVQPNAALSAFVREQLIFDPEASAQYAKTPFARHLRAYRAYRNAIDEASQSEIWGKIDAAVAQVVANYYGISLTNEEATALINFVNEKVIPVIQARGDLDQSALAMLDKYASRYEAQHFAALNSALNNVKNLESQIALKLTERAVEAAKKCDWITSESCKWIAGDWFTRKVCEDTSRWSCAINLAAWEEAQRVITRIDNELNGTGGLRDQLMNSAIRLRDQAVQTKTSAIALIQAAKDMQQAQHSNTSPVKAYLNTWKSNLDLAMTEYVSAASGSMLNTMNPAASSLGPYGAFTPMKNWFDCYHLSLSGAQVSCAFYTAFQKNWADLQKLEQVLSDATSLGTYVNPSLGLPTPQQVREEVERLKARAISELTAAAINAVEDLLPPEVRQMVAVLGAKIDEPELRQYFTAPSASKQLLMIPDIDVRVKADMYLNLATNTYDPTRYAVVANAVTLSKLALLDNAGLTQLAQVAGVPYATSGAALFAGTPNVVANAFASIDGNHQWLTVAPPRPSSSAPYVGVSLTGYPWPSGYASAAGFVPWRPEARNGLFRSLFLGPLAPGFESPTDFGLRGVLRSDYPYQACRMRPYPDGVNDKACVAAKILPALLSTLLD